MVLYCRLYCVQIGSLQLYQDSNRSLLELDSCHGCQSSTSRYVKYKVSVLNSPHRHQITICMNHDTATSTIDIINLKIYLSYRSMLNLGH